MVHRRLHALQPANSIQPKSCTGVKKSLVLEPGTSKISIRTSKYFHPMSDGQAKIYSARLYFLEWPELFGNRTSKNLGVLVHRTSEHSKIFLPLMYPPYMLKNSAGCKNVLVSEKKHPCFLSNCCSVKRDQIDYKCTYFVLLNPGYLR